LERVERGYVRKVKKNSLELFTYTPLCTFKKEWDKYTIIARGIILSTEEQRIVAYTFPKFFNYLEIGVPVPDLEFSVDEKLDGSLIILFCYNDVWEVATKGSFESSQALWARKWIDLNIDKSLLIPSWTYLFEAIYPENQIVVNYSGFSGLVLLSMYDGLGYERYDNVKQMSHLLNVRYPKRYEYNSLEDILNICKNSDKNLEGFVVRFNTGYRLKIKSAEYLRVHRIINRVTPLGIWEVMLAGDDLENIYKELPEEFQKDFRIIVDIYNMKIYDFVEYLTLFNRKTRHLSNKELGLLLKNEYLLDKKLSYIFYFRDGSFWTRFNNMGSAFRRGIFTQFRPTGNDLEGYIPSSSLNMFLDETAIN